MNIATKTSKGFTLIELLVVIAIIGILSSVVLTSLTAARAKARDGKRIAELKSLQIALELYYESHADYPATLTPLVTESYISSPPLDPTNDPPYVYTYTAVDSDGTPGTCETYYLSAELEVDNTVLLTDGNFTTYQSGEGLCTGSTAIVDGSGMVFQLLPY